MGRTKIRATIAETPNRRLNLKSGRYEVNHLKEDFQNRGTSYSLKKPIADGKKRKNTGSTAVQKESNGDGQQYSLDCRKRATQYSLKMPLADGKKRKYTGSTAVQSSFNMVNESKGDGQQYSHDLNVMELSHGSDVMKQPLGSWVSSSATISGDELNNPVIVRCVKLGDVEIVKEIESVVYLKEHSGEEVRLDPTILFADVGEADRSRLLQVFVQRPDTFMRMGSLGSFFVRFALESFSRMWGMLESTKIGDLSKEELDDLLKSFGDMQRCLIKTDWLEAKLKRMGGLKKAKLERIDKLKTINTEREKARSEIEELKVLLSKAEEKKHKLDEEAQALCANSEEDISLEWSVVEGLFAGSWICSKHAGVVQNWGNKRNRGEGRTTSKGAEEGWLEGQQKDKQKGRRLSEGISFAGREHYGEGASSSENSSDLVVMAGGKPTAVLIRSPSSLMAWKTCCGACSHECPSYSGVGHYSPCKHAYSIIHASNVCPTVKTEVDMP